MFCKNCGAELADGSRFCSQCGTNTESAAGTSKLREIPEKIILQHSTKRGHDASTGFGRGFGETLGKKFGGLVWGIIIIVVIIVIIGLLLGN